MMNMATVSDEAGQRATSGPALDQPGLDLLFLKARTHNAWLDRPVPLALIRRAYDIARMGPTSMNCQPMRLVVLASPESKERLRPTLSGGNVDKTIAAPVTLVIAYDLAFQERLPALFAHMPTARAMYDANPDLTRDTAFRNGTMQGTYLTLALRALGLDVGSMSGFDAAKVDAEFLAGTNFRTNWLVNVGYGDASKLRPSGPRLEFDEVATVL